MLFLLPITVMADEPIVPSLEDEAVSDVTAEEEPEDHKYAEFSDMIINWPADMDVVPEPIHPVMEFLHDEVKKRSITNEEVCNIVEEMLHEEEEKPRWKKFLNKFGITLGHTAIFSSGVVFAFLACTFAWYIPTMIKKWWDSADGWRALRHKRTYTDETMEYMTQDELNQQQDEDQDIRRTLSDIKNERDSKTLDSFKAKKGNESPKSDPGSRKGDESPFFHPYKHQREESSLSFISDVSQPEEI